MTAVRKLTLGLRTENKTFRIDSIWGMLVDSILEARGKEIPNTYYTQIAETSKKGVVNLLNEDEGNSLLITRQDIAFTKDAYPNGHVNLDEAFSEFSRVWNVVQKTLKLKGVRRIGIVAEHRLNPPNNNNLELMAKLTKLTGKENVANFSLHFENRVPVKAGTVIDVQKGSFTNLIYDFYDSAIDTTDSEVGKINANFDYQNYFTPSLDTRISEEMENHFYAFKKELVKFDDELKRLGFKK